MMRNQTCVCAPPTARGDRAFMAEKKKSEPSFEKALERLEQIVAKLEDAEGSGKVSLDESIKLFQEGRKLGRQCAAQLADAEKKARLLLEDEQGAVTSEPFEAGADTETAAAPDEE